MDPTNAMRFIGWLRHQGSDSDDETPLSQLMDQLLPISKLDGQSQ
jgi:hypothetical protein